MADGEFQFCPICGERLEAAQPPPADPTEVAQAFGPAATAAEAFGEPPPPSPEPAAKPPKAKWPVSTGWTIVITIFTAFTGLLALLAIYLWRGGHRTAGGIVAAVFALFAIGVIASIAGSGSGSTTTAAPLVGATTVTTATHAKPCSSFTGAKPRNCISKTGIACSGYGSAKPDDCYSVAELRVRVARHKAQVAAAARARKLAARRAAAAARAQAAAFAAANAWHKGYFGPLGDNSDIYFKWRNDLSCADYASDGCVRLEITTADGCSYLSADSNEFETKGGPIVGDSLDNQSNVPPHTPVLMELDADRSGVTYWSAPTFVCD